MPETIDISAEERNELWHMAEFAHSGAGEEIVQRQDNEVSVAGVRGDRVTELRTWFDLLDAIGLERDGDACEIPVTLPTLYAVDAALRQAREVIEDESKTMARSLEQMTAPAIAELFLPPAEADSYGSYLVAYCHVKAVRERIEAAEPRLREGGGAGEEPPTPEEAEALHAVESAARSVAEDLPEDSRWRASLSYLADRMGTARPKVASR